MKLRVLPWLTPRCIDFLNNIFKWLPATISTTKINVLEIGGGNSSLYFLSKGCNVVTIESEDCFIEDLQKTGISMGYSVDVCNTKEQLQFLHESKADLKIIKAENIEEVDTEILLEDYHLFLNDGISRHEFLDFYVENKMKPMIILDNTEYAANCGHLRQACAYPERILSYRRFLRSTEYNYYLFEQAEGREGHRVPDSFGEEIRGRWLSTVAWHNNSIYAKQIITDLGFPLVINDGIDDSDVLSVREKNPYPPKDPNAFITSHKLSRKFD